MSKLREDFEAAKIDLCAVIGLYRSATAVPASGEKLLRDANARWPAAKARYDAALAAYPEAAETVDALAIARRIRELGLGVAD